MLCLPFKSPLRASNLFPGGARRSPSSRAAFSMSSFLAATDRMSGGIRRTAFPWSLWKNASVAASVNDAIKELSSRLDVTRLHGFHARHGRNASARSRRDRESQGSFVRWDKDARRRAAGADRLGSAASDR